MNSPVTGQNVGRLALDAGATAAPGWQLLSWVHGGDPADALALDAQFRREPTVPDPDDRHHGPCPFASGGLDPERVLDPDAPSLVYYQIAGEAIELHVSAEHALGTVRLSF